MLTLKRKTQIAMMSRAHHIQVWLCQYVRLTHGTTIMLWYQSPIDGVSSPGLRSGSVDPESSDSSEEDGDAES